MKRVFLILACAAAISGSLFADDLTDIYKQLYEASASMLQKAELMQGIADSSSAADAPYLGEVLLKLNSTDTSRFKLAEKDAYERTLRLLCQKLGDYGYKDSQDELIKIAAGSGSSVLRAAALVALGKVGGSKYAEVAARMLDDLNIKSIPDRVYGEQLAYGLIMALAKFKDIRGWRPVFNASKGWYGGSIKQLARVALVSIVEDPTSAVKEVIEAEDLNAKRLALGYELESKATDANKIAMCVLALQKGVDTRAVDPGQRAEPLLLRKLAIESLIKLKDSGEAAVPSCVIAYSTADMDEKLLILSYYGANKSDAAALALADVLKDGNAKRLSGVSGAAVDQIMNAALANAGLAKNQKALDSVLTVGANELWSPSVLQSVKKAKEALQAK